jgi:hypothetical protein
MVSYKRQPYDFKEEDSREAREAHGTLSAEKGALEEALRILDEMRKERP